MTKQCTRCKESFSSEDFYKSDATKDGLVCYCKFCCAEYRRHYYSKFSAERKKENRKYHRRWLKRRKTLFREMKEAITKIAIGALYPQEIAKKIFNKLKNENDK